MSSEFPTSALGDLILHQKGFPFKSQDYVDSGVPVVRVSNFTQDSISIEDIKFVDDSIAKQNGKVKLREDDIIIATVGSWPNNPASIVGKTVRVPKQLNGALMNQNSVILRSKSGDKVDQKFLFFALKTKAFSDFLVSNAQGSANQASITLSDIFSYEVEWPAPDVRKSVVAVIDSLSGKIELNRQTNQTLEQIAQALFKSWFVDFEPTRAKIAAKDAGASPEEIERAAMCAISGKTPDQLAQLPPETQQNLKTTAALFPDALVDSELGEVPEGWKIKTIDEVSKIVAMGPFGSNIKVETFVDEGIPIINGQQLKGTLLEDGKNKFVSCEHATKLSKCNVFRGDIVITHRGTLGQVSIIPEGSQYERYIVSQSQCFIRPDKEVISPLFLIFYFKSEQGQHELLANKSQVGVPSIAQPVTNLRKIKLLVSNNEILDEFQKTANSMHKKISKNLNEISCLESTRDALLTKLLSGQIQLQENEETANV